MLLFLLKKFCYQVIDADCSFTQRTQANNDLQLLVKRMYEATSESDSPQFLGQLNVHEAVAQRYEAAQLSDAVVDLFSE